MAEAELAQFFLHVMEGAPVAILVDERIRTRIRESLRSALGKNSDALKSLWGDWEGNGMRMLTGTTNPLNLGRLSSDDLYARDNLQAVFPKTAIKYVHPKNLKEDFNSSIVSIGGPTPNEYTRRALGYEWRGNLLDHDSACGLRFYSYNDTNEEGKAFRYGDDGRKIQVPSWTWRDSLGKLPDFTCGTMEPQHGVSDLQHYDYVKITHLGRNPLASKNQQHEFRFTVIDGLHGLGTRAAIKLLGNRDMLKETEKKLRNSRQADGVEDISLLSYEAIFKVGLKHNPNKKDPERGKSEVDNINKLVFVAPFKFNPVF